MKHSDFVIGGTFYCGNRVWRCTDIGTRTIIAMRFDSVEVERSASDRGRTLSHRDAEAEDWFNGPPYAVEESVFDEYDLEGCSLEPAALFID